MGLWNWASEKIRTIASAVKQTVSAVRSIIFSPYLRNSVSEFFIHTLKGFLNYFQPSAVAALLDASKTSEIALPSFSANFLYIFMATGFEVGRNQLPRFIPDMENPLAEYTVEGVLLAVNTVALLMILRRANAMRVDNFLNNISIPKAVTDDVTSEVATNNPKPICEHVGFPRFQASCASAFYYIGTMGTVWIVENAAYRYVPVIGEYAAWPLRTLAYGQALVEYKLSSLGTCTPCRYKILSANKAYAFGGALPIVLSYELIKLGLYKYVGLESSFLADAVFNVFFQYGIIASIMNDRPLPGKSWGFDIFLPGRLAMESWMNYVSNWVVELYSRPDLGVDLKQRAQTVANYPLVYMARKVALEENLQSEAIVTRPSFKRVNDVYEKITMEWLEWLERMRNDNMKAKIAFFSQYLPNLILPQEKKDEINLAFDPRLNDVIINLKSFIRFVRAKNNPKSKQYNEELMNEAIQLHDKKSVAAPLLLTAQKPEEKIQLNLERYMQAEPAKVKAPVQMKTVPIDEYLNSDKQPERRPRFPEEKVRLSRHGIFGGTSPELPSVRHLPRTKRFN